MVQMRVKRPSTAAPHEKVQDHDGPEQRIFEAACVPIKPEARMIYDGGEQKDQDRHRHRAGEQAERETEPSPDLGQPDQNGPQQARPKTGGFEERNVGGSSAEQLGIAMGDQRQPGIDADQRLGEWSKRAADGTEKSTSGFHPHRFLSTEITLAPQAYIGQPPD